MSDGFLLGIGVSELVHRAPDAGRRPARSPLASIESRLEEAPTSWSRLVSSESIRICEPQIGRAVLAGLIGGCALGFRGPLGASLTALLTETTIPPRVGFWTIVLGQRFVLSAIFDKAVLAVLLTIGSVFVLVLGRSLLRSRPAGLLFLGGLMFLFEFGPGRTLVETAFVAWQLLSMTAIYLTLLVCFGPIAMAVSVLMNFLCFLTATTSWTTWHGQPGLIALVIVALLAAYGFWAATAGRPLFGDVLAGSGPNAGHP